MLSDIDADDSMIARLQPERTEDFSLVLGGPLYQLLLRSGLVKPPFGKVSWRVAVIVGIAWLPLVPLTILRPAFAGGVRVPFLYDCEVHSQAAVCTAADDSRGVNGVCAHARDYIAVCGEAHRNGRLRPAFSAVSDSAMRLRNSVAAEVAISSWLRRRAMGLARNSRPPFGYLVRECHNGRFRLHRGRVLVWFVSVPVFQLDSAPLVLPDLSSGAVSYFRHRVST